MSKIIKFGLLFSIDLCLILLIVTFLLKIKYIHESNVKGIQHVNFISKENLEFGKSNLKHYYEPKANNFYIQNPDWLGYEVKNHINSDTLNDEKEINIEKDYKTYRIIAIGDSFTYGDFVKTANSYPKVLEKFFNDNVQCENFSKFEVLNLGVSGYDLEYAAERLVKRGLKYKPDLVIWLINDWNVRKISELYFPLKEKLIKDGIPEYNPENKHYRVANIAINGIIEQFGIDNILNYQEKVMNKLYDHYHGKLLIASFSSHDTQTENLINDFIKNKQDYFYFDRVFDTGINKEFQFEDGHPNEMGYKRIVESISNYILDKNLLPCK